MADRALTIAVASGKGGVGKSTVAALLAAAYAEQGMEIALLDADLYGPSIPTLFHGEAERHQVTADHRLIPIRRGRIQLVSFGFILGQLPAIMRGPMIARYTEQLFNDVHWQPHRVLIIDLPPGTGDIHLTATQSQRIDVALIVTTPHALSFSDVGKAILMLNKVRVPIAGCVLNMTHFICDQCQTTHHLFGSAAPDTIAMRFGVPVIARLPLDPVRYSQRLSSPAAPECPDSPAAAQGSSAHPIADIPDDMRRLATRIWEYRHAEPPPSLSIENSYHEIRFTDSSGLCYAISPARLRRACRCAICYDEYRGVSTIDDAAIPPDVFAKQIKPVGNYALYIQWSDGHDTGFFPLDYICRLAHRVP